MCSIGDLNSSSRYFVKAIYLVLVFWTFGCELPSPCLKVSRSSRFFYSWTFCFHSDAGVFQDGTSRPSYARTFLCYCLFRPSLECFSSFILRLFSCPCLFGERGILFYPTLSWILFFTCSNQGMPRGTSCARWQLQDWSSLRPTRELSGLATLTPCLRAGTLRERDCTAATLERLTFYLQKC